MSIYRRRSVDELAAMRPQGAFTHPQCAALEHISDETSKSASRRKERAAMSAGKNPRHISENGKSGFSPRSPRPCEPAL